MDKTIVKSVDYEFWNYEVQEYHHNWAGLPNSGELAKDDVREFIWYSLGEDRWIMKP